MALFKQKTPQEIAAEKAKQAEASFRASPTGRALAALERGDEFFQIQITQQTIQSPLLLSPAGERKLEQAPESHKTDVLGQIQEVGWHLEHASWLFVQTGMNSKDELMIVSIFNSSRLTASMRNS